MGWGLRASPQNACSWASTPPHQQQSGEADVKNHSEPSQKSSEEPTGVSAKPARVPLDALAIGLIVAMFLIVGGAAYASFSAGGTGSGSAPTGTMQAVTISAFTGGDQPTSTLIPGGTADVIVRVTNPNPAPVQVFSVTSNGSITADSGHPGCTTTGVTFTAPSSPLSPAVQVLASSTLLFHLAGAASMDLTSVSACQGATFEIPVTLTARQ